MTRRRPPSPERARPPHAAGALPRWLHGLSAAATVASVACTPSGQMPEGLDASRLPAEVRSDYDVFSHRCSKCHSLARPLTSGITEDVFWHRYVEKMRRQAGSGISPADEPAILRFLHYYSVEEKRRRGEGT